MKSTNIVLTGKQQVELRDEPVPDLPPDGVAVRTRVSLISSGTETICYRGESDPGSHWHHWVRYPFYLGYSNVGVIEQIGAAVSGFAAGERVFTTAHHHQVAVARGTPIRITDAVSDESAAWSKLATIAQTGVRRAQLAMGATVAIIGLGPLGQLLSQYARVMGAERVIAIDPLASRLDVARAHGATHRFAGSAGDALPFVEELTGGARADVVFDATGHPPVLPLALPLAKRFGLVMLIGDAPNPSQQVLTSDVITRQISIRGTHNENLPGDHGHARSSWCAARRRSDHRPPRPDGSAPGLRAPVAGPRRLARRAVRLVVLHLPDARPDAGRRSDHRPPRGRRKRPQVYALALLSRVAPEVIARLLQDRGASLGVLFDWSRLYALLRGGCAADGGQRLADARQLAEAALRYRGTVLIRSTHLSRQRLRARPVLATALE